ncbi:hypothetical protein CLV30_102147 [Haloactinopolyspora alba]|uniref:Hemerythrin HHE cation binding domain-containing protein n=1 Tax=Haloactinopolyspora alba TaxID=648780 RepID=A0A2P8EBB4_9ACTN|nr:hemerythrin domain-containing protein [Haloactinopolyspora alba]PSL06759.1 hypothetical protein CLV30_102147 [Haloactinopolyspora alba]
MATRPKISAVLDAHETLRAELDAARRAEPTQADPRRPVVLCDTFLATMSRHIATVEDVLYPRARRLLPRTDGLAAEQVRIARNVEHTMRAIEGTYYGDAYAPAGPREPWWALMADLLAEHDRAERVLLARLCAAMSPDELDELTVRFATVLERAPTRPHPYSPHSPRLSRWQHRFWAVADRMMDAMDNRVIPTKPRTRHGAPDSLLTQYLVGSPRSARSPAHR